MKLGLKPHEVKVVQGGMCECYSQAGAMLTSKLIYDNHGQPGTAKTECQFFCCGQYNADFFIMNGYDNGFCDQLRFNPTFQDWEDALYS